MDLAIRTSYAIYASRQMPFTRVRELGRGAFAVVDEVRPPKWTQELGHNFDGRTFARKVLKVPRRQKREEVLAEMEIAAKLRHYHHVEVMMTYEETPSNPWEMQTFGMIMNPVAQYTLQEHFDVIEKTGLEDPCIKKWFGYLTSGLAFLHMHRIRHKDIKPANILVRDDCVLFSDFGVSKIIDPEVIDTQTEGPPGKLTYKYAAPEVIAHERRGRKADVFSLGCVFAEMITIMCGILRSVFEGFRGPPSQQAFHESLDRTLRWLFILQPQARGYQNYCCACMVPDPGVRISSHDLEKWIICGRKNVSGTLATRGCECLGTEPAGEFRTVSLGEGPCMPPYSDALDGEIEITWTKAMDYWIGICKWSQDTPRTVPRLFSTTAPLLAENFPVHAERFFPSID